MLRLVRSPLRAASSLLCVFVFSCSRTPQEVHDVLTQHNDNSRTGTYLVETTLKPSNVTLELFGKLFELRVEGQVYAQPLYVEGVHDTWSGVSLPWRRRNVLYVATENNTVYAFDADGRDATGHEPAPLWKVHLDRPFTKGDLHRLIPHSTGWCDTITLATVRGEPALDTPIGITSTPVIDVSTNTLYVVTKGKEVQGAPASPGHDRFFQKLYALDIRNGRIKRSTEIEVTYPAPGEGKPPLHFDPVMQLNRPGLLLLNGVVFLAFGSHCDLEMGGKSYHGWVLAYDGATLKQLGVYCTTPGGSHGGIWQSGNGLAADQGGFIYFMTGNTFPGATPNPPADLSNSFVKLRFQNGFSLLDWFTPCDTRFLSDNDLDLGSSGPVLLPGSRLVGGGKMGRFYMVDTSPNRPGSTTMGHWTRHDASDENCADNQIPQSFQVTGMDAHHHIHGSPVVWSGSDDPNADVLVYVWAERDYLRAYRYKPTRGVFDPETAVHVSSVAAAQCPGEKDCMPGGILSLSADGHRAATGIVWASTPWDTDANHKTAPGVLRAFNASTLEEIWNSKQEAGDDLGYFAKFCPPTIARGKVFMATFSNKVVVYGLRSR